MAKFGETSKKKLSTAERDLQRLFEEVVKTFDCTVLYGHRTPSEQLELYKQGRELKNGEWVLVDRTKKVTNCDGTVNVSMHNYLPSKAVDVVPYPINFNDYKRLYMFVGYVLATANALGIKVRSGADWDGDTQVNDQSFNDLAHFEIID